MPIFTPCENDPDRFDVEYDYKELKRLYRNARDIFMFSRIMSARQQLFKDEEMACITRIYTRLVEPLENFIYTVMNAPGDIAIDREHDPQAK